MPRREWYAAACLVAAEVRHILAEEEPEPFAAPHFLRGQRKIPNACGTTCVQMLQAFFGENVELRDIESEIRRWPVLWTNPNHILRYLRRHQYRSQLCSNTTDETFLQTLTMGVPMIVLVDSIPTGSTDAQPNTADANLHYQFVYDCRVTDGQCSQVLLCDPAGKGQQREIPYHHFVRSWTDLRLGDELTGINRLMITAVPNDEKAMINGKDNQKRSARDIDLPGDGVWGKQSIRELNDLISRWNLGPEQRK